MLIENKSVSTWVNKVKKLVNPKKIVWVDGSGEQTEKFYRLACENGNLIKLNERLQPNCYLHRSNPNDVARVEDKTFICCEKKEDAGFANNWMEPESALEKLENIAEGSYSGRMMYIIPFSMAHPGSKFAKLGVEITDSVYVALSMIIMTRVGNEVYEEFKKSEKANNNEEWIKCLHCSCECDENNRYICHFPEKNMIFSVNSSYGGNALLGKKCLALRLASYMGRKESRLAEHMLILGIKIPDVEEIKYICAAFPSGCGKTNLALLKPEKDFEEKDYKVWCVGDDIAWLRIDENEVLRAVNPENGFFGIGTGTNKKTNPNALKMAHKNTIFTNTAYDTDSGTVWWEGLSEEPPEGILDWQGKRRPENKFFAHPNSRFASPAKNCPCLSPEFDNPDGVPISAIIFGGMRTDFVPLVMQAKNWAQGVFFGASISSETTHAAAGKTGVLRHDPFAMLPFCGYNMSDYFKHWLDIGGKLGRNAPEIFSVNWFRTDENGKFIWPGFSENLRVLEWIVKRCEGKVGAKKTFLGLLPNMDDLNTKGLDIDKSDLQKILEVDEKLWEKEKEEIKSFYKKFDKAVPSALLV
jgi:phosphoenolpyruvate carboxykinase (GTP)